MVSIKTTATNQMRTPPPPPSPTPRASASPERSAHHVTNVAHHHVHRHVHVQQSEEQHHRVRSGVEEGRPTPSPAAAGRHKSHEPKSVTGRQGHALFTAHLGYVYAEARKKGGGGRRVGADLMTKNRKRQDNI